MSVDRAWDELPDAALVGRALSASRASEREAGFAAIFARHHRVVLALCGGRLQDPDAAKDAAAETFAEAFKDLATLREPDKLRSWLISIAANRCRKEWERRRRQAPMPEHEGADEDEAGDYERASRARHAQVDRMLDAVAASFTAAQQQIFHHAVRQGLVGAQLATVLGVKSEEASRKSHEIITLAYEGFGALVLAQQGRRYCPVLARILDRAAWNGDNFTKTLRLRILRHLNTCLTCDNCSTCNTQRPRLVTPYTPALIPILIAPLVQAQTSEMSKQHEKSRDKGKHRRGGAAPPSPPDPGRPAARPAGKKHHTAGKKHHTATGAGTGLVVLFLLLRGAYLNHAHHQWGPTPAQTTLNVWVQDPGLSVYSSPADLTCLSTCHGKFTAGTRVTLTSTYQAGSLPLNWVGCDTPTASAEDPAP